MSVLLWDYYFLPLLCVRVGDKVATPSLGTTVISSNIKERERVLTVIFD